MENLIGRDLLEGWLKLDSGMLNKAVCQLYFKPIIISWIIIYIYYIYIIYCLATFLTKEAMEAFNDVTKLVQAFGLSTVL